MAKKRQKPQRARETREDREDQSVVRGPSRVVNPFGDFKIPAPKGKNPGPVARSVAWKPRAQPAAEDPEEAAAFGGRQVGDVLPQDARNRRVSAAALSAAQQRMHGQPLDTDDEQDEQEEEYEQEAEAEEEEVTEQDEPAPQHHPPNPPFRRPPAPAPAKSRVLHESEQYEPAPVATQMPASRSGVKILNGGDIITHPNGLYVTKVTIKCVDRLWDWIRSDGDHGKSFLGAPITTSLALHQYIQYVAKAEEQAQSCIRSIFWYGNGAEPDANHLGFVMLSPILAEERTALMHVYLKKDARNTLGKMIGPLVDMAEAFAPGMHLAVYSRDEAWARLHKRLLEPLGFTSRIMFIR